MKSQPYPPRCRHGVMLSLQTCARCAAAGFEVKLTSYPSIEFLHDAAEPVSVDMEKVMAEISRRIEAYWEKQFLALCGDGRPKPRRDFFPNAVRFDIS